MWLQRSWLVLPLFWLECLSYLSTNHYLPLQLKTIKTNAITLPFVNQIQFVQQPVYTDVSSIIVTSIHGVIAYEQSGTPITRTGLLSNGLDGRSNNFHQNLILARLQHLRGYLRTSMHGRNASELAILQGHPPFLSALQRLLMYKLK
jgi:hypothetical protein